MLEDLADVLGFLFLDAFSQLFIQLWLWII